MAKNRYFGLFWPIWPLPVGCFWPKWSKRTSTDQDLSFEPITKSLWASSIQKFWPVQQVFSEHEQTPTPPKSFSSISEDSITFRSRVLSHTSSSLEKPLFSDILANLTTSGRGFLTEMVKRHIYRLRPFIWAYNQVSVTFRSKVVARTKKYDGQTDGQTDRQTDGRTPQTYRPPTFWVGA